MKPCNLRILRHWLLPCPLLCILISPHAQTLQWEWVNGANTINPSGVYGSAGTAAAGNTPGGRYYGSTWLDASGYFWLYGGAAYDASGSIGFLNDLWRYNPSSNQWTWINGGTTVNVSAVYGTKGTTAAANTPGARYSTVSMADANGNLWLFAGGFGSSTSNVSSLYNDLWKYNIATGLWTWVGGSSSANQAGVYGTKGTAAATNIPGARFVSSGWIDASGNIWIFGGVGYDASGTIGYLNDLWKYNIATGLWTWMSGSSANGAASVYGTKGTAATANTPGARYASSSSIDANGNLWLFGGGWGATTASVTSFYNDLWKYTPSTGAWTWVSGSNTANLNGVYGTKGAAAAANYPGGRRGSVSWMTVSGGSIWLLGGLGYSATGTAADYLDDLWQYNIATNTWTWVTGDNTAENNGIYGTMGTPGASNNPGARYSGLTTWTDASQTLWLFGGRGYPAAGTTVGYLNDLWKLVNVTVLATDWLNITAIASGDRALLNWEISGPPAGGHFTIQRSADARNWMAIGTLAANGTTSGSYSYMDEQPMKGTNLYQVRYDEGDGTVLCSKTVTVRFGAVATPALNWTNTGPNAIQASLANGSGEAWRLLDIQGNLLQKGSLQNGQVRFSRLLPGIYILQVMAKNVMMSAKILVP